MTYLHRPAESQPVRRAFAAATLCVLASAASATTPPPASFTAFGDAANYSNPAVWEHHQIDITALVAGASSAQLAFDFSNDQPGTGSTSTNAPTNAHLAFASDSSGYYLNFEYFFMGATSTAPAGTSSAHLRDVSLLIDGALFRDQFGAFDNHLGDTLIGTATDGDGPGFNILGQTGFEGRTYTLTAAVPEPETYALMLAGLGVLGIASRRRASARYTRAV